MVGVQAKRAGLERALQEFNEVRDQLLPMAFRPARPTQKIENGGAFGQSPATPCPARSGRGPAEGGSGSRAVGTVTWKVSWNLTDECMELRLGI